MLLRTMCWIISRQTWTFQEQMAEEKIEVRLEFQNNEEKRGIERERKKRWEKKIFFFYYKYMNKK